MARGGIGGGGINLLSFIAVFVTAAGCGTVALECVENPLLEGGEHRFVCFPISSLRAAVSSESFPE